MKQQELEKKLAHLYANTKENPRWNKWAHEKKHVFLEEFDLQKTNKKRVWKNLFSPRFLQLAASASFVFILSTTIPFLNINSHAKLRPSEGGVIEIIKNGESFTVKSPLKLKKNDVVSILNNGEALLETKNMSSRIEGKATFQVTKNDIVIEEGRFQNKAVTPRGIIRTERGIVQGDTDAYFVVQVSSAGETLVIPQQNKVTVSQENEAVTLNQGERINLYADTKLSKNRSIQHERLTTEDQKNTLLKLDIARTKTLSALESNASLDSAIASFVGILSITKEIQNIYTDAFSTEDVLESLQARNAPEYIYEEAVAVQKLLEKAEDFVVNTSTTGAKNFDRYVLVSEILIEPAYHESRALLQDKYVERFINEMKNNQDSLGQVTEINRLIHRAPDSKYRDQFFREVRKKSSETVQKFIDRAI